MGRVAFILIFLGLMNAYAGSRLVSLWPWAAQHAGLVWLLVLCFFILQLSGPFGERMFFPAWRRDYDVDGVLDVLVWISYLAFGIMSVFIAYALVMDVIRVSWKLVAMPVHEVDFDRRALMTLGVATVVSSAIGVWQAVAGPTVRRVEIRLKNLPAAFDGAERR
jgi:hypothetical protein